LVIPPLFFACASLSPVTGKRESPLPRQGGIEELVPVWRPLYDGETRSEYPEIFYYEGRLSEPKIEFWAVKTDIADPRLAITVYGGETSVYVKTFVEESSSLAGINGTPFAPVTFREGEKRTNTGIVVSDGKALSPPAPGFDALVFFRDGRAAILSQAETGDPGEIENALGGFRRVLEKGALPERLLASEKDAPRHPRSAAGLSSGGELILLAVDGRRPGSRGVTEAELGLILKKLGAFDGLNFDGGGSTALAVRFPDGKVRTVNTPIHNHIPGLNRGVAACLGLGFR
jgi:exopolysaccharide biosynthesis protein